MLKIPTKYQSVPTLIVQFVENMLNPDNRTDLKDNAKRTLDTINDFINWAIKTYETQLLTSNKNNKKDIL